jgi:hypothetical protein
MTSLVLKSMRPGAEATVHMLAFMPEPQVLELHLSLEGSDQFVVGSTAEKANRFLIEPRVPGVKGVLASLVGKQPSPIRMWLTPDPAPGMLKVEGALYRDGPIWRITPAVPRWKQ